MSCQCKMSFPNVHLFSACDVVIERLTQLDREKKPVERPNHDHIPRNEYPWYRIHTPNIPTKVAEPTLMLAIRRMRPAGDSEDDGPRMIELVLRFSAVFASKDIDSRIERDSGHGRP